MTAKRASAGEELNEYINTVGMTCTITPGASETVECTTESPVLIGHRVIARIRVNVPAGTTGPLENTATIAGGGAPEEASTSNSTPVVPSSQAMPCGLQLEAEATREDGQLAKQAGSRS